MMDQFTGECVGGPLDGKWLAHTAESKKFYRGMTLLGSEHIDPLEIGEYRKEHGHWVWHRSALAAFEEPVSR